MTLAMFLSRAAQSDALIEGHVVADHRGFSDDHPVSMVDEKSFSDLCARMNLDSGFSCAALGNPSCQEKMARLVQPVRHPVMEHHLEAGIQKYLQRGMDRRIPLPYDADLFSDIANQSHNPLPFCCRRQHFNHERTAPAVLWQEPRFLPASLLPQAAFKKRPRRLRYSEDGRAAVPLRFRRMDYSSLLHLMRVTSAKRIRLYRAATSSPDRLPDALQPLRAGNAFSR